MQDTSENHCEAGGHIGSAAELESFARWEERLSCCREMDKCGVTDPGHTLAALCEAPLPGCGARPCGGVLRARARAHRAAPPSAACQPTSER